MHVHSLAHPSLLQHHQMIDAQHSCGTPSCHNTKNTSMTKRCVAKSNGNVVNRLLLRPTVNQRALNCDKSSHLQQAKCFPAVATASPP